MPLTDDQRRTHRGARFNAIDPKANDIVDLDAVKEPEGMKYLGADPVLVAADFQT